MTARQTNGKYARQWPDPDADRFPSPLLLDRHRLLHSTAFRRLQYKSQVFLPFDADHARTRLTHTLEVAQMGMILAETFSGDRQLTEVICLAHDVGHGPFGHAGEQALNAATADTGGFEHNDQSVRVVEYLERPYPQFTGLNLTAAVRAGLRGHSGRYDRDWSATPAGLESSLASYADRLAYDAGDLEDALGAKLITLDDLSDVELVGWARDRIDPAVRDKPVWITRRPLCEQIQRIVVESLTVVDNALQLSTEVDTALNALETFLFECVYRHEKVARADALCRRIVTRLFEMYRENPDTLPKRFVARTDAEGLERVAADYISGMTDRFCLKVYRQHVGQDDTLQQLQNELITLDGS